MQVIVHRFRPPGRGEFAERTFEMPDTSRPKDMAECIARSKAAMLRCWPTAKVSEPNGYLTYGDDEQYVEAEDWKVSWLPDDWKVRAKALIDAITTLPAAELLAFAQQRKDTLQITPLGQLTLENA